VDYPLSRKGIPDREGAVRERRVSRLPVAHSLLYELQMLLGERVSLRPRVTGQVVVQSAW